MRFWHNLVRVLVFGCASFFAVMGVLILLIPLVGTEKPIEPGHGLEKAILGLVFLLAAAPMYYYVFSRNLERLNQPRPKPPAPGQPPPEGPATDSPESRER